MTDIFDGPHRNRNLVRLLLICVAVSLISSSPPARLAVIFLIGCAFWRLSVRDLMVVYLVLVLVPESPADRAFLGFWSWPIENLGYVWYANISTAVPGFPIKLSLSLLAAVFLLWRCWQGRVGERCTKAPLEYRPTASQRNIILAALIAVVAWTAVGQMNGGDLTYAFYGAAPMAHAAALVGVAMCVGNRSLGSFLVSVTILIASLRAFLCVFLYVWKFRYIFPPTLFITTHADSMVWAIAILALVARYLEDPGPQSRRILVTVGPLLAAAVAVNTRRLSFVILAAGLMYMLFSSRWQARRRLSRAMPVLLPLAMGYVIVGLLLPPSRAFSPVQSVQSVSEGADSSSQTREAENYNVILSMKEYGPLGAGFGLPYTEKVAGGDISQLFAGYLYLPHNNILGLLFFAGPLGFTLMVMPMCMAMHRAHAVRRRSRSPDDRVVAGVAVTAVIGYFIQAWGDFGFTDMRVFALAGIMVGACAGSMAEGLPAVQRTHGGTAMTTSPVTA